MCGSFNGGVEVRWYKERRWNGLGFRRWSCLVLQVWYVWDWVIIVWVRVYWVFNRNMTWHLFIGGVKMALYASSWPKVFSFLFKLLKEFWNFALKFHFTITLAHFCASEVPIFFFLISGTESICWNASWGFSFSKTYCCGFVFCSLGGLGSCWCVVEILFYFIG